MPLRHPTIARYSWRQSFDIMKILIIYATVTGTTEECVSILKKNLTAHDLTVCDIEKSNDFGAIDEYDTIIVGGPIRYGRIHKSVGKFLRENSEKLEKQRTAYFICAGFAERADDYFEDILTPMQRKNALCLSNFGGDLSIHKQKNWFMKLLVRFMRNDIRENGETDDIATTRVLPTVNPTEISKLSDIVSGRF